MSALHGLIPMVARLAPLVDDPDTDSNLPGGLENKVQDVVNWIATIATMLSVVGVIIVGITMALAARRGEGSEVAARLGWVAAGCVLIGTSAAIVNALV